MLTEKAAIMVAQIATRMREKMFFMVIAPAEFVTNRPRTARWTDRAPRV
jgi:hypothetical protein